MFPLLEKFRLALIRFLTKAFSDISRGFRSFTTLRNRQLRLCRGTHFDNNSRTYCGKAGFMGRIEIKNDIGLRIKALTAISASKASRIDIFVSIRLPLLELLKPTTIYLNVDTGFR